MTIHHVHVKLIGAGRLDASDGLAQGGEIGRQDAGRDLHLTRPYPIGREGRNETPSNPVELIETQGFGLSPQVLDNTDRK